MGMDASVTVWVGVKVEDVDDLFGSSNIPSETVDALEEADDVSVNGIEIRPFWQSDNTVGVGVEVYWTDWDYGVQEVDLSALHQKTQEVLEKVRQVFAEWGIPDEPKVYLHTDYS